MRSECQKTISPGFTVGIGTTAGSSFAWNSSIRSWPLPGNAPRKSSAGTSPSKGRSSRYAIDSFRSGSTRSVPASGTGPILETASQPWKPRKMVAAPLGDSAYIW